MTAAPSTRPDPPAEETRAEAAPPLPAVTPAPEPPRESPHEATHKAPTAADTTLRVDVGLLDRLMNLVGELVLTRNQVLQYNAGREDAALHAISQRLNLITTELQEGVMKTRMQPIGVVWNKLPRSVRDLAAMLNKRITLDMDHGTGPGHHRGDQGSAHAYRAQLLRPRYREPRAPRGPRQTAPGPAVAPCIP